MRVAKKNKLFFLIICWWNFKIHIKRTNNTKENKVIEQKMWHEEVEVTVRFLESRKDLNRAVRNRQVSEGQDKVEQSRQEGAV